MLLSERVIDDWLGLHKSDCASMLRGDACDCEMVPLSAEIAALEAELQEHDDYYRKVVNDECAPDEVHCTCVPALRDKIDTLDARVQRLTEDAGVIVVGDGLRVGKAWVENLQDKHKRLLEAGEKCWPHMFDDIPAKGMKSIHYEKFYDVLKEALDA